jgi:Na+-translocating ferredoxin:NAD+ oxidoreductase RnfG subunit
MMIISIIAIVLAVLAIVFTGHLAIVYQRFNDGIKDWAESLDNSTKDAIDRSARQLLIELD